jgi:hypothetical protein
LPSSVWIAELSISIPSAERWWLGAKKRNEKKVKVNWLFDTLKARTKLKRHYCKVNPVNEDTLNTDNNTRPAGK